MQIPMHVIYMVALDSKICPPYYQTKIMYSDSTRNIKRKIDPKTVDVD